MPTYSSAQIVISEIMYNPDGVDTGREWVELYNAGTSDVSIVAGTVKGSWRISDGSNHTFVDPSAGVGRGSLTIPSHGYVVISNDPATFQGDYSSGSFSLIKSSISLNNTGATVALIDGDGTILDSTSYTKDQGAYDDGMSLQKTASGSWIAALPTPGAANATVASTPIPSENNGNIEQQNPATQSSPTTQSVSGTISSYVAPPEPELYADAGADRTVVVGADIELHGKAYDSARRSLDPATTRFFWNFGDGHTAEGAAVLHHWEYPGVYAVVLSISQNKLSVSDTIKVTAKAASLTFTIQSDGSVSIHNGSTFDIDVSHWIVTSESNRFILPDNSLLFGNATIRISSSTLGFAPLADAVLSYPNGALALRADSTSLQVTEASADFAAPQASPNAPIPAKSQDDSVQSVTTRIETSQLAKESPVSKNSGATIASEATSSTSTAQLAAAESPSGPWWYISAFALIVFGGVALYFSRKRGPGKWEIIEEIAE